MQCIDVAGRAARRSDDGERRSAWLLQGVVSCTRRPSRQLTASYCRQEQRRATASTAFYLPTTTCSLVNTPPHASGVYPVLEPLEQFFQSLLHSVRLPSSISFSFLLTRFLFGSLLQAEATAVLFAASANFVITITHNHYT